MTVSRDETAGQAAAAGNLPSLSTQTHGAGVGNSSGTAKAIQPHLPATPLALTAVPRHAVIRSRVLMQRTPQGVKWSLPPPELLEVGDLSVATSMSSQGTISTNCFKRTCQIGEGALQVPVEMVAKTSLIDAKRRRPVKSKIGTLPFSESPSGVAGAAKGEEKIHGTIAGAASQAPMPGANAGATEAQPSSVQDAHRPPHRKKVVELTKEFHGEVKDRLNRLQSSCRVADFESNPRAVRLFLKDLDEICNALESPLPDKPYRNGLNYSMLTSFARLLPAAVGADLPSSGELPTFGFLAFSVVSATLNFDWKFTYNFLTHKVCDCHKAFPNVPRGECLVPADGGLAKKTNVQVVAMAAAPVGAFALASASPGDYQGISAAEAAAREVKLENMRRNERHLPLRLPDLARALRRRFSELTTTVVPMLVEDFLGLPTQRKQLLASNGWERFVAHFMSEARMFDRCYMQFEQLYLDMAGKMVSSALAPVCRMTGPSSSLVHAPTDPFTNVQAAALCQRLGFMKRRVDFAGAYKIVNFDPGLLVKARRIREMNTYREVQHMAASILDRFDALCQVLVHLRTDQINPELNENAELKTAVVELEKIWAECHFVLQQDCLDFTHVLLEVLPALSETCRWQLWAAMHLDEVENHDESKDELNQNPAEKQESRTMLFETLPILLYMTELWHEVCLERIAFRFGSLEFHSTDHKAFKEELLDQFIQRGVSPTIISQLEVQLREPGITAFVSSKQPAVKEIRDLVPSRSIEINGSLGAIIDVAPHYLFRELFCQKDDRHHTLRRDFAKFDEQKFAKFRGFLLGDLGKDDAVDALQAKYFRNVHRQLKEVAAFPTGQSPIAVVQCATSAEVALMPLDPLLNADEQEQRQLRNYDILQARARWVCVQRLSQAIEPALFPKESPLKRRVSFTNSSLAMPKQLPGASSSQHLKSIVSSSSLAPDSSQRISARKSQHDTAASRKSAHDSAVVRKSQREGARLSQSAIEETNESHT